jgi:UPF0271 protein
MTTQSIDINADLGEGEAFDNNLYPLISSANIACGYHAGDAQTMRASVRAALRHDVAIGAHPSLDDRASFGRTWIDVPAADLHRQIVDQVTALLRICGEEGAELTYVKAHGALYNRAAVDAAVADVVARAIGAVDPSLQVFTPPGSQMERIATQQGIPVIREAFADRAYNADGTLVSRETAGAVLHDPEAITRRMIGLVTRGEIVAHDGSTIALAADTICIHSDTPGAVEIATTLRQRLAEHGIDIRSHR